MTNCKYIGVTPLYCPESRCENYERIRLFITLKTDIFLQNEPWLQCVDAWRFVLPLARMWLSNPFVPAKVSDNNPVQWPMDKLVVTSTRSVCLDGGVSKYVDYITRKHMKATPICCGSASGSTVLCGSQNMCKCVGRLCNNTARSANVQKRTTGRPEEWCVIHTLREIS